jgi:hypothetical protein
MSDADREGLLKKLQALLSKTVENGCTEAEAQAALAKVSALMEEHRISSAEIEAHTPGQSEYGGGYAFKGRTLPVEYAWAIEPVEFAFGVKVVITRLKSKDTGRQSGAGLIVFGTETACQAARWGFDFLSATFKDLWNRYRIRFLVQEGEKARESYYAGLALGLMGRLRHEREMRAFAQPVRRNELARIDSRLDDAFAEAFPDTKKEIRRAGANDHLLNGAEAGSRINLARQLKA